MKRPLLILAGLLMLILAGCRGGVLVFKGTHEQQDEALLSKLAESYPSMSFTCTGRSEGAVHTVEDGGGVEFPAWTAAKGDGGFQVMDYYLEEWLRARGYFDGLESSLEEQGFSYSYHDYNHYDRHFQFQFGALDDRERLEEAAGALAKAKSDFDSLRRDFEDSTGCRDIMLYFHGSFTIAGEEHFGMFHMSMGEGDIWEGEYPFDDYLAQLTKIIENIDKTPAID